ncbi:hypothetical protein CNEO4_120093 [Clostridium neonatale]|uniref:hypothetical protein n=1 Tax=Clostridium neonatale TaxID=137838 RepID=UPI00291BF631|nr:hypothetical protein [Clostridium neonatale]CAI3564729.1 hypothetical protein CNEO4_120093 [Clostridium neonatale]
MIVSKTMKTISTIIDRNTECDIKIKRQLFKKLLKKSESKIFDGWNDFRINMLKICAQFADIEEFRGQLTKKKVKSLYLIILTFHRLGSFLLISILL